ncbi:MAG: copper amine oxidase N-terminal domain-containing protein, partial [Clostridia bacterium]|nr:copper amine oxidase N-terminal domain-containing protein [Clostridia bacterium]
MRKIFEALDAKVDWEGTTQTITATKDDTVITLQINNSNMYNNGVAEALDVAPVIVNNSTFVPVRAVSQSLKADVEWLGHNQSVYINSPALFKQASENIAKTITMYAPDGRTIDVLESEIEAYKNVGWYIEPVTQMYALDGRTIYVPNSEVEAHKNVGWYLTPVTTMYASDGRTIVISQDEITNYKNVGWYETEAQAQAANKVNNVSSSSSNPSADGYYYRTPTGKKYHLDPNCGGKNSRRTTNISGLSPCSKCAQ